jgi:hypothetical protein
LEKFKASIGSNQHALGGECLIDDTQTQPWTNMSESDSDEEDDQTLDNLYESATEGEIDLDKTMASAAHVGKSQSGSTSFV